MTAIKQLKTGKAAGPDSIPLEALKVDINSTVDRNALQLLWEKEKTHRMGRGTHCEER